MANAVSKELHEFYVAIVRKSRSEKAILIQFDDKRIWIPVSQIKFYDQEIFAAGWKGNIKIPYWLAYEKDMI